METLSTVTGMVGLLLVWGAYALGIVVLSAPMACVAVLCVAVMVA